ncbi:MAG: hypothetical protein V3U24_01915 [Candidatus Neomarinimicrobiota bacterium]
MGGSWIYEPMTSVTDFFLGLVTFYCAVRISEVYWQKYYPFHFHLSWTLYMISGAAFLSGILHGFGPHFPEYLKNFLWGAVLQLVNLSGVFFLLGSLSAVLSGNTYGLSRWIPVLAFLVYSGKLLATGEVTWAVRFCGPVIVFALVMMVYLYLRTDDRGIGVITGGLVLALVSGLFWVSSWSPDTGFSHNDIYHVVQTVALWVTYRGALATGGFESASRRGAFSR